MRLQRGRALVTPRIISCDLSLSGHSQAALPLPHVKASFTAEALAPLGETDVATKCVSASTSR